MLHYPATKYLRNDPNAYWWGKKGPRQSSVIQRELVRLEICERGLRWKP